MPRTFLPLLLAVFAALAARGATPTLTSYALVTGSGRTVRCHQASIGPLRQLQRSLGGDFFWFREGQKAYVIRDPAALARITAILDQADRLDGEEEALDQEEDRLDTQLEAVEERLEEAEEARTATTALKQEQATLQARQADLKRRQKELGHRQHQAEQAAEQALRALGLEAIRSGLAAPADRSAVDRTPAPRKR